MPGGILLTAISHPVSTTGAAVENPSRVTVMATSQCIERWITCHIAKIVLWCLSSAEPSMLLSVALYICAHGIELIMACVNRFHNVVAEKTSIQILSIKILGAPRWEELQHLHFHPKPLRIEFFVDEVHGLTTV
jgi:hypothetical protein